MTLTGLNHVTQALYRANGDTQRASPTWLSELKKNTRETTMLSTC